MDAHHDPATETSQSESDKTATAAQEEAVDAQLVIGIMNPEK